MSSNAQLSLAYSSVKGSFFQMQDCFCPWWISWDSSQLMNAFCMSKYLWRADLPLRVLSYSPQNESICKFDESALKQFVTCLQVRYNVLPPITWALLFNCIFYTAFCSSRHSHPIEHKATVGDRAERPAKINLLLSTHITRQLSCSSTANHWQIYAGCS